MAHTENAHRLTVRLSDKDYERLRYWAEKRNVSINEFIPMLVDRWVDLENGNYQLPTLEVARMNQLIDGMTAMSQDVRSLSNIVINGFDSLLSLTRGDNYLLEEEDGELV